MRLKFDDYVIDAVRRELWNGPARVPMEPQVFDLLAYLVQNPDRVVSRDELLQAIWDGRAISDSAIANRINGARRAIGDSGEAQRLIRTVPRRGFRFVGPVAEAPDEAAANQMKTGYRRSIWRLSAAALAGAAIAIILARPEGFFGRPPAVHTETSPSVLVSALAAKSAGAGVDEPRLAAITVDNHALAADTTLPRPAKAAPAAAKPPREIAAATAPVGAIIPAAVTAPVAAPPASAPPAQKSPLPDVAIATPASLPGPVQQVNPPHPLGSGVDEAAWPVIPCATARIDLGAGAKCQMGRPTGGGHCEIARQVTMITNARYQIEADVKIVDPTKITATGAPGRDCMVWSGYTNMPDDFKNMNEMTRRASSWANFGNGNPQSTASFVENGRNCVAVERLGPPWHGGYVWVVHASICSATGAAVQNADIDAVFATLQLRTYDAQGNLRASLQ
jgi:DNA-binding winged helix-turn-helix (wHTH) protein